MGAQLEQSEIVKQPRWPGLLAAAVVLFLNWLPWGSNFADWRLIGWPFLCAEYGTVPFDGYPDQPLTFRNFCVLATLLNVLVLVACVILANAVWPPWTLRRNGTSRLEAGATAGQRPALRSLSMRTQLTLCVCALALFACNMLCSDVGGVTPPLGLPPGAVYTQVDWTSLVPRTTDFQGAFRDSYLNGAFFFHSFNYAHRILAGLLILGALAVWSERRATHAASAGLAWAGAAACVPWTLARWNRLHVPTRLIALFSGGLVVWANTIPYYPSQDSIYASYGWPCEFLQLATLVIHFADGKMYPPKEYMLHGGGLALNILAAILILSSGVIMLERLVWPMVRNNSETANPKAEETAKE